MVAPRLITAQSVVLTSALPELSVSGFLLEIDLTKVHFGGIVCHELWTSGPVPSPETESWAGWVRYKLVG